MLSVINDSFCPNYEGERKRKSERKRKARIIQIVMGLILLALCGAICAVLPECGDVVFVLFPLGLYMLFTREIIIYMNGGEWK